MASGPRWWLYALGSAVAVFLIAPSVVVVLMSFSSGKMMMFPPPGFGLDWYRNFFNPTSGSVRRCTVCRSQPAQPSSLLPQHLTAFGLVKSRPGIKRLTNAVILSPMIVPVVVSPRLACTSPITGWG